MALLVGARPRGPGMERSDLLEANGGIFKPQGEAINAGAADDIRVLVVGNPANTNCLIAMSNAPDVPRERFTAMIRLDHNRAISQLANKLGQPVTAVTNMTVWGNHSTTQYPDLVNAKVNGAERLGRGRRRGLDRRRVHPAGRQARRRGHRGPRRLQRRLRRQRGDRPHPRLGARHAGGRLGLDVAVPADGSYGVEEGIVAGFPCTCSGGEWSIVEGLEVPEFSRARDRRQRRRAAQEERDAVSRLGLI